MNIVDSLIIRQNIQYFSWTNTSTCETHYKWRNNFDFDIEFNKFYKTAQSQI